ncbi:MAG: sulfotransferase, partial [Pseudomonadota bacterium]
MKPPKRSAKAPSRQEILGAVLHQPTAARLRQLDRLIAANRRDHEALLVRSYHRWSRQGDASGAEKDLKAVLSARADDVSALANLAEIYRRTGRRAEAMETAEACLAQAPSHLGALNTRVRVDPGSVSEDLLARLCDLAARAEKPSEAAGLHNLLGVAQEARGDYASAFRSFTESNRRHPDRYDRAMHDKRLAFYRRVFTPDFVARLQGAPAAEKPPVLIVGPPRSGTTLVEQMALGDPQFASCGESPALERFAAQVSGAISTAPHAFNAEAAGRFSEAYRTQIAAEVPGGARGRRVVDKMPQNFMHLGFALVSMPNAAVAHTVRHPLATLTSCYRQSFVRGGGFSNSVDALAHFFGVYVAFMRLWRELFSARIADVVYERLASEPEPQSKRLLAAIGGAWRPECLGGEGAGRMIRTSSAGQADRAVYDSSI